MDTFQNMGTVAPVPEPRSHVKQVVVGLVLLVILGLVGYGIYVTRDGDDFGLTPSGILGNIGDFPLELLPEQSGILVERSETVPAAGTVGGTQVVTLVSDLSFQSAVNVYTKKYVDEGWTIITHGDGTDEDGVTNSYVRKDTRDVNLVFEEIDGLGTRVTISTTVIEPTEIEITTET